MGVVDCKSIEQRNPQGLKKQNSQKKISSAFQIPGEQGNAELGFQKGEQQAGGFHCIGPQQGKYFTHHFFLLSVNSTKRAINSFFLGWLMGSVSFPTTTSIPDILVIRMRLTSR